MSKGEKSRSIDTCLIFAITLSILLDFFFLILINQGERNVLLSFISLFSLCVFFLCLPLATLPPCPFMVTFIPFILA